jgi:carboxypeptidase C (cathepsin A)
MQKYPSLSNNTFYIMSESYGGHYMPTLAQTIVEGNAAGKNPKIPFGGFMVGNPYTDPYSNRYGTYSTFYGHQLVSKQTWDAWIAACPRDPALCLAAEIEMETQVGDLNPYALDYPVCLGPSPAKKGRAQRLWFLNHAMSPERKKAAKIPLTTEYDPCIDNYAIEYLNRPDVQQAIHAKPTVWAECSYKIIYNPEDGQIPMEPIYQNLLNNYKMHILVYSGDDDSVCSTSGSQAWIYNLGYPVNKSWTSWTDNNGQVGGYTVFFDGTFKFVTVHSAGHEVPTYQPMRALEVFSNYLKGVW